MAALISLMIAIPLIGAIITFLTRTRTGASGSASGFWDFTCHIPDNIFTIRQFTINYPVWRVVSMDCQSRRKPEIRA